MDAQRIVGILFDGFKYVICECQLIFMDKVFNKIMILVIFSIA